MSFSSENFNIGKLLDCIPTSQCKMYDNTYFTLLQTWTIIELSILDNYNKKFDNLISSILIFKMALYNRKDVFVHSENVQKEIMLLLTPNDIKIQSIKIAERLYEYLQNGNINLDIINIEVIRLHQLKGDLATQYYNRIEPIIINIEKIYNDENKLKILINVARHYTNKLIVHLRKL